MRVLKKNDSSKYQLSKDLISVIVEMSLLEIGQHEFKLVESKLKQEYNCNVSDCLLHPYYLKTILSELYGDNVQIILNSIEKKLEKVVMDKQIQEFLLVLKQQQKTVS